MLLRLALLLMVAAATWHYVSAMPSPLVADEVFADVQLARERRRVGQVDPGSTALSYMNELRENLADEGWRPKNYEQDPTSVWCFLDKDIVEQQERTRVKSDERCATISRFVFDFQPVAEKVSFNQSFPLAKGLFRPYLQVIPRHLEEGEMVKVSLSATIRPFGDNASSKPFISVNLTTLNVSLDSNGWLELDLTDTLRGVWPPREDTPFIELNLTMRVDCKHRRKVPATFVNPAEIPLAQKARRGRHEDLQPLFVIWIDDNLIKTKIREEKEYFAAEVNSTRENDITSVEEKADGSERKKRGTRGCALEDFEINFRDLRLNNILAPAFHNVGRCSGDCSHSSIKLNRYIATNHAKIMASAQIRRQQQQQEQSQSSSVEMAASDSIVPCCVPTKYNSVYLMLHHNQGAIELSLFPDFSVLECGCR